MSTAEWPDHLLTLAEWDALPVRLTAYLLVDGEYERVAGGTGAADPASPAPLRLDLDNLLTRR